MDWSIKRSFLGFNHRFNAIARCAIIAVLVAIAGLSDVDGVVAQDTTKKPVFTYEDVFQLEYATGFAAHPDGSSLVYERRTMDIHSDSLRINLWEIDLATGEHRPLFSGESNYRSPVFSPNGDRLAYVSSVDGKNQLYVRWMKDGRVARLTDLDTSPGNLTWAPDGKTLAFTLFVPESEKPLFSYAKKPKGAKWAPPAKQVSGVTYRADGAGYLPTGHNQIFVLPSDGGTPRQITKGKQALSGRIVFDADNQTLYYSANVGDDWALRPNQFDIYRHNIVNGNRDKLPGRTNGPDIVAGISPDRSKLIVLGLEDEKLSSQLTLLQVMNVDGSAFQALTEGQDISVSGAQFAANGQGIYYSYDRSGKSVIAYVTLSGAGRGITDQMGGTTLGRPYTSGSFMALPDGRVAFTLANPGRPADIAVVDRLAQVTRLTDLNSDLLDHKTMARVEGIQLTSSVDGRALEAWVAYPPDYDPNKTYPLLLEIHGGPHTAYGPQFSAEVQLYAAAGYVVVYGNPRGSTSYGKAFANEIHHNYPSEDHNDLMDMVDAVISRGSIDTNRLFITGGSGGGVLTAWAIGKTNRFRAAVVAKPVINWTSFVLTADFAPFFTQYWFPAMPWEDPMHYWNRSPLSLVGNVKTPTMLLTGEQDYRTPISETEQYYQALKLRGVDSVMVRIQNSGHGIAAKPSNLIQKVGNILAWFEKYDVKE